MTMKGQTKGEKGVSMYPLEVALNKIPREELLSAPTQLSRLRRMEERLGYKDRIYIKRDDLTAVGCGGNKIRCLEYILGEALDQNCDLIIASGPQQSNLCALTAAACAKLGLECINVHDGEPPEEIRGNLVLNHILGVEEHFIGTAKSEREASRKRAEYIEALCEEYRKKGRNPYFVRNGATTGMGALGYARAIMELKKQCQEKGLEKMTIFAPGGNGGIASGLIYGNAMLGQFFRIVIISVEDDKDYLLANIERTIQESAEITGVPFTHNVLDVAEIVDDYRGEGWGFPTKESSAMVINFAREESIFIENVYTSKVVVGMEDWIKKGKVDGPACFLHTGGFGSLFAQY